MNDGTLLKYAFYKNCTFGKHIFKTNSTKGVLENATYTKSN